MSVPSQIVLYCHSKQFHVRDLLDVVWPKTKRKELGYLFIRGTDKHGCTFASVDGHMVVKCSIPNVFALHPVVGAGLDLLVEMTLQCVRLLR